MFTKNAPAPNFGNLNITVKPHLKYLGIEIDESLTFKDHVHKVKTSCSSVITLSCEQDHY